MPTYVYRCTQCNHTFEVFQRITDEPISECEVCAGPVNKVFHPAGIVFKGKGFYVNDHGRNRTAGANGSAAKGDTGSGLEKSGSGSEKTRSGGSEKSGSSSGSTGAD